MNLKEEWSDIGKCTLGVLLFFSFCFLNLADVTVHSILTRLGMYVAIFVIFWGPIVLVRIWDNTEARYRRKIYKRNRRINKR